MKRARNRGQGLDWALTREGPRAIRVCLVGVVVLLVGITLRAQDNLKEKSDTIQALLLAGKFDEAEPLIRRHLEQAPEEISYLSQLDMVLNGQGKFGEADELRDRIRKIWVKKYKKQWIAKGSPVAESSWARIMTTSRDYQVVGAEYFAPQVAGIKEAMMTSFYQVIAFPKLKEGQMRLFKLNMTKLDEEFYVLEEYGGGRISMVKRYGSNKPDIRAVVADAVAHLDKKVE